MRWRVVLLTREGRAPCRSTLYEGERPEKVEGLRRESGLGLFPYL